MRTPFPRDIRALRDRFRREVRGALKMLLRTMPRPVGEWFVAELDAIVGDAESMLWDLRLGRQVPPPDPAVDKRNRCALCHHPQSLTVVRPYGHVCATCDRDFDAELTVWDEICQGKRARR